jgi:hypothetical protein
MLFSRHRRSGQHVTRPRHARCAWRLQVEQLEDRNLLSVQVLATLGDPAPGPGAAAFLINDFEPAALNNRGDVLYAADLSGLVDPISGLNGEGIFLRSGKGQVTRLAGATEPAPGGGTYGPGVFSPSSLNDQGDVAFSFILSPFTLPFGVNGGTFRYSHSTNTVTPVVLPFVTPAPGGGVFQGTVFFPHLNNGGDLLFDGIVPTDKGIHVPDEDYIGLGQGIFMADKAGHIASVVSPGDAAPGGGTFDFAGGPWSNDGGDIAFLGHVAGDPASIPGNPPQSVLIAALSNGYVKDGATGTITEFAHAGGPIPASAGGGVFRQILNPQINNAGEVLFKGDLTPAPDAGQVAGLFRYSRGAITAVARPGDAMPGGGHLVTVSFVFPQEYINNRGDIVFNCTLDTDVDGDGLPDQGTYQWSHGQLSVVARTGTVLAGVGTVRTFVPPAGVVIPAPTVFVPNSGAINNDRGQVLFSALLTDGRYVLLLATPSGGRLLSEPQGPALTVPNLPRAVLGLLGGPESPALIAVPARPASRSTESLPHDLTFVPRGKPGSSSVGFAPHRTRAHSEPGARSQALSLPALAKKPAAQERAAASLTSPTSQGELDPLFAVWADILSGVGNNGKQR